MDKSVISIFLKKENILLKIKDNSTKAQIIDELKHKLPELKKFYKKNVLLLLALFWSVIAFSVVFRPSTRACVTTEVLSLLLLVSICNDYLNQKWKIGIIAVLFAVFTWDSMAAIEEAKAQQQAYREGKTQVEAIDLSSVENMLKSMGI